ncbi:hypothetical protein SADUNF_Sadunf08G0093700 [Salix dunnii]|uniref:Protein decapping 5 n=1 Tax=Salix dunnii TaxID=1413687 RepID=A0A835MXQ5_9ROSI|nr:hypothetical protein SADUNF_Sadunf08G0093700 [Salix dunnii]
MAAAENNINTASTSRSNSTADSYIGSLISLTSKSKIRYEGILYNINTEESSIGLKNGYRVRLHTRVTCCCVVANINCFVSMLAVRSFGTEGRKKDGPQILPSDKVYEYILFRGSDIKFWFYVLAVSTASDMALSQGSFCIPIYCILALDEQCITIFNPGYFVLPLQDLQVKSSPPVQSFPPINNDPAIIQVNGTVILSSVMHLPSLLKTPISLMQSHYPRPVATSTSLASVASGSLTDLGSQIGQGGLPGSNFQGGLPLYQPGGSLGTWGVSPPPPNANGSGLAMPMYWQSYYAPPNGLPHLHQSLLRPPPGLAMPPSMPQPMQYPNFNTSLPTGALNLASSNLSPMNLPVSTLPPSNLLVSTMPASLPDVPLSLLPGTTSSLNFTSHSSVPSTLPSSAPLIPSTSLPSETLPNLIPNKVSSSAPPMTNLGATFPVLSPVSTSSSDLNTIVPPISSKPSSIPGPTMPYQSMAQSASTGVLASNSLHTETPAPTPPLVTPDQLLQPGPMIVPLPQPVQTAHKDVEVVKAAAAAPPVPESAVPDTTEAQPPILPLPVSYKVCLPYMQAHTYTPIFYLDISIPFPNGANFHARHGYRGRERGRASGSSRPVTKFTEDFDFMAMNEKFKKDEVWGHLGKNNKSHLKDREDGNPVYNKDDFFDTISCNAFDNDLQNGRTRFSEQMKLDTETFGDFTRYRGGRGGRGPPRGGRSRGSYYGRGYGYGYAGRGRGTPSHAS